MNQTNGEKTTVQRITSERKKIKNKTVLIKRWCSATTIEIAKK